MVSTTASIKTIAERQAATTLRITRYAGPLALVPSLAMIIFFLFKTDTPSLLAYGLAVLPIAISSMVFPHFYRNRRVALGQALFIVSLMIMLTLTGLMLPDYFLIMATATGAIILLSFMLLGKRRATWFALAAVVLLAMVMVINEFFPPHWFPSSGSDAPFFANLIASTLVMIAIFSMARLSFGEQETSFTQIQQANESLNAAADQANQSRARLETVIQQYDSYMAQISKGNMLAQLSINESGATADEPILALGNSLTTMTSNLHSMILKIREASQNITIASTQILAANTQQVASATQTSASIAQTTTTVEELKSLADHSLSIASGLAESAQRTVEVSQSGQQSVSSTILTMNEIRNRVEGIAASILALSEKTQQIGEIITMVSDLAAQSNMLALNASIEASRAGEAGKGFGVVAQEMRSLAEQSRKATIQIKEILSEIQSATNSTVMATEEGSKVVDRGVKQVESAQRSIEQLSQAIDQSDQMAKQMSAGGRQQLVGVEQVAMTMQHINQATTQNVTSSHQTENAARNLNQLAQSLVEEISKYKV